MSNRCRRAIAAAALATCSLACSANESFGSEFSHFLAGGGIAAAATLVADHYGMEHSAIIGFGTSVGISFVLEAAQIATNGSQQVRPSALDFASNLVGAALGAWITDRSLTVTRTLDASGRRAIGVAMNLSF